MGKALILGVVLKGLPVAYSLARMNSAIENCRNTCLMPFPFRIAEKVVTY